MSYMGPDQIQGNLPPNSVPPGVLQAGAVSLANLDANTQSLLLMSAGFRNMFRNGNFGFDFGGRPVANGTKGYFTEWWYVQNAAAGQAQGSYLATLGNGIEFTYTGRITALAANALTAGSFWCICQSIEGAELRRTMWGTPKAKACVLSFWARASAAGTYSVSIRNADATRAFVSTFQLGAGVWQKITINVPACLDGVWATDATLGAQVWFAAGCGSNYQTSILNVWQNANLLAGVAQTQLMTTNAAVLDLTGVQFELGSTPTDFEWIPFGSDAIRCSRYYGVYLWRPTGLTYTSNGDTRAPVTPFASIMRATPTVVNAPANLNVIATGNAGAVVNVDIGAPTFTVDAKGFHQNSMSNPSAMATCGAVAAWGAASSYTLYMDAQL
jgi:hypothetical protein